MHSRTESESSTSRLARRDVYNNNDYSYEDDPYAVPPRQYVGEKGRQKDDDLYQQQERTNSYLPYSHHRREDPFATPEPIYLEDERLHNFGSSSPPNPDGGGVGSLLQDTIAMDMADDNNSKPTPRGKKSTPKLDPLPTIKKRRKRRCCGLRRRILVFLAFILVAIIAAVWFFVWPRAPSMQFLQAGIDESYNSTLTKNIIQEVWNITMTVDNSQNWVPTHMKDFYAQIVDANTGVKFGTGNSGSMVLPPRQSRVVISIPMKIGFSSTNEQDPTLQDIIKCRMKETSPGPQVQESLNVIFYIDQYIAGIAWKTTSIVHPSGFQCPSA